MKDFNHNHCCPHCKTLQTDLWDYDWRDREVMITECSGCERPIDIVRRVDVTFRVEAAETGQEPSKAEESK